MGASQSSLSSEFRYNLPISTPEDENETPVYRSYLSTDQLIANEAAKPISNAFDLFMDSVRNRGKNRMLGKRVRKEDGKISDTFEWMTYEQVYVEALRCGTNLVRNQLVRTQLFSKERFPGAKELRTIGIFGKNSCEWFIVEQACNAYGYTLCPLYDTFGRGYIIDVLEITKLNVVFCDYDCWPVLFDCITAISEMRGDGLSSAIVNNVILINPLQAKDPAAYENLLSQAETDAAKYGCKIYAWEKFLAKPDDHLYDPEPAPPSALHTLCFTSGTTGKPKGVIIPHSSVIATVTAATRGPINPDAIFDVKETDVFLSYLPLAHVLERCVCNVVIYRGGALGVFSGDITLLLDDIKHLKPTVFVSVPRLFNRINDKITMSLQDKGYPTQMLFSQAVRTKVLKRRTSAATNHKIWDGVLFSKIRDMLGGNIRTMISGGAPLDPLICERMCAYVSAPLLQGYGLSESFGPCFLVHEKDERAGGVGGVWPAVEFKLVSVPEMDYRVTDKPSPRGELWLRGPGLAKGYFMEPEATDECFTEDGWFRTGDIATLDEPRASLRIIDRMKAIFKLSQGEYVCPERIEGAMCLSPLISQVFVYGYSLKSYTVALIVPELEAAQFWAQKKNIPFTSLADLCTREAFLKEISKELDKQAERSKLRGFEKIRRFALTAEPFTVENDLLTPTAKVKRQQVYKLYRKEIDELYEEPDNATTTQPK